MVLAYFDVFQTNFKQRLASPSLRMVPGSGSNKVGPEIRQIGKHSVSGLLASRRFLKSVHRIIERYAQQVQMKEEMLSTHKELAAAIKQVRYVQKTLCQLQKRVEGIDTRLSKWLGWKKREDFYEIIKSLKEVRYTMEVFETDLVSNLPPHMRKPDYKTPKWESLIKIYDHRAADLREKAAMQAVWERINFAVLLGSHGSAPEHPLTVN